MPFSPAGSFAIDGIAQRKGPEGVAAPARLAILQRSCFVPYQRDDVKLKVPIWFVISRTPGICG
ncbi:hypothetical protein, partial [Escherichia coli]|uniref:hypothetical protein n=1 Tax=Escherichia coli TaxID=562 RepID=UPI001BE49C2A